MTSTKQHYRIDASPETIWPLVEDARRHFTDVMGSESLQVSGEWPRVGSVVHHQLSIGPLRKNVTTIVRHARLPGSLRLEIRAGLLGTLGLDLEIRPWGEGSYAAVQEYPLSPSGLHSFAQSLPLMCLLSRRYHRLLFSSHERPARSEARV
ncbi:hypothetical protein [Streptomyces sp. EMB24]|uniref:hypothetical protein n=1 Tax=Streptomyces sp. EMB24 TaxID=2835531 RepID=UPI00227C47F3|nr:hypothetical protein [Streptomyces sp. EMB24]